jgi:hypothetical protein
MFANENMADEHNPCAIIINSVPLIPHVVIDIVPATIKPMCPTDE